MKKQKKMVAAKPRGSSRTAQKTAEALRTASSAGREFSGSSGESPAHRWTFLTNHAHVLGLIHTEPDLVLRQVAYRVGITERAVQRIVQDLEEGGFLVRERVGRRNRYQVVTDVPLRHPIEAHRNIGDLLALVANRDTGN
jgi:hypothetical protein